MRLSVSVCGPQHRAARAEVGPRTAQRWRYISASRSAVPRLELHRTCSCSRRPSRICDKRTSHAAQSVVSPGAEPPPDPAGAGAGALASRNQTCVRAGRKELGKRCGGARREVLACTSRYVGRFPASVAMASAARKRSRRASLCSLASRSVVARGAASLEPRSHDSSPARAAPSQVGEGNAVHFCSTMRVS